mgnify:CR=1 FL=1
MLRYRLFELTCCYETPLAEAQNPKKRETDLIDTYDQPSISPLGIRIDEPITTLTDLMVSGICFYAFIQISKREKNKALVYFQWYFLTMGVATAFGGIIGHAFLYALGFAWKLPGWLISMISITVLERAMIEYSKPLLKGRWHQFFGYFNLIELATFAFLSYYYLNFQFVEIHSGYGLIVFVLAFSIFNFIKREKHDRQVAKNFIVAVGFAALGGLVFMTKSGISPWLNHNDISHLFLCGAAWFFYVGARKIKT